MLTQGFVYCLHKVLCIAYTSFCVLLTQPKKYGRVSLTHGFVYCLHKVLCIAHTSLTQDFVYRLHKVFVYCLHKVLCIAYTSFCVGLTLDYKQRPCLSDIVCKRLAVFLS